MSQLVQAQIFYYNDQDSGLTDTTYCPDAVLGDECPSACWFDFAESGGNGSQTNYYQAFVYQINNVCLEETNIQLTYDAFGLIGNIFSVTIDDVLEWTSGCIIGSGFTSITIPAGTRKVRFDVIGSCAGGSGDLWNLTSVCL